MESARQLSDAEAQAALELSGKQHDDDDDDDDDDVIPIRSNDISL